MKERIVNIDDFHIKRRTELKRRLKLYKKELEHFINQEEKELAKLDETTEMILFPLLIHEDESDS
jgi:hypothetical protein